MRGKDEKKMSNNLFYNSAIRSKSETYELELLLKKSSKISLFGLLPFPKNRVCLGGKWDGSTAMAAAAQSQQEIIIKIAQTPCVT